MKPRTLLYILFILLIQSIHAQNRYHKLSVATDMNMYSYGDSRGSLNNTVRTGIGFTFQWESVDTAKKSGMVYETGLCTTSGYYKMLPGNNVLEVEDTHLSAGIILPIFILFRGNLTHRLGLGIGVSTLLYRDFYDENGTVLSGTSPNYPDVSAFKYWNPKFHLDYELAVRSGKRSGFIFGTRYNVTRAGSNSANGYKITEGSGVSVKLGLYYRFGLKF